MRASAFEIDGKGIIAQNYDDEGSYVNLGNLILEASAGFSINDGIKELFLDEGITASAAFRMPPPIAVQLKNVFMTDLSWVVVVPGTYTESWPTGLATRMPCAIEGKELEMPIIFYFKGGENVLFHEGIHTIRSFINSGVRAFEEAVAKYGIPNPTHNLVEHGLLLDNKLAVDAARQKLEDKIGLNASYALLRLSREEVYGIKDAPDTLAYLKSLDCLRHKIMKEKLGI